MLKWARERMRRLDREIAMLDRRVLFRLPDKRATLDAERRELRIKMKGQDSEHTADQR